MSLQSFGTYYSQCFLVPISYAQNYASASKIPPSVIRCLYREKSTQTSYPRPGAVSGSLSSRVALSVLSAKDKENKPSGCRQNKVV